MEDEKEITICAIPIIKWYDIKMDEFLRFPKGFFWGTATSAHQVEGNSIHSDWWKAEQEGKVPYKSGRACDSYNRYEEDFGLAKAMHNNAHRFSIEWARIEPEEGKFKEEEIEHYRKVIHAAKERGLEPFVTLHHFTNPQWFAEKGGWTNKIAPEYFERYVKFVAERLGKEAQYWITINEPLILIQHGYLYNHWPPFKRRDTRSAIRAIFAMIKAHKKAYRLIHAQNSEAKVGIAHAINYLDSSGGIFHILKIPVLFANRYIKDRWFLNRIKDMQDFIGVNHYSRYAFSFRKGFSPEGNNLSDFGWQIYPQGIYYVVKSLKKYKCPVYITENGIADAKDDHRSAFIVGYLKELHRAIEEGADVRGYFHWSLLDNFEWSEGFNMKFGLVEVNFETLERTLRPSAKVYAEICRTSSLEIGN
ncbi:MAG: glycoside hydrolase family 1 protein [Candidatus Wildermuthbacteria bacterium]|nr:glycoside hydrolase family 1 protein [Candidatus Wildermuthbacteria bacterium]